MLMIKQDPSLLQSEISIPMTLNNQPHEPVRRVVFHFGQWQRDFLVRYRDDSEQQIGLPENLDLPFQIPLNLKYQVKLDGHHLILGPVVGFITNQKKENLAPKGLNISYRYMRLLDDNGLTFICAVDGINVKEQTIEGYYYSHNDEEPWKKGVFPFPAALYRRATVPNSLYSELVNIMGDEIFNSYPFNKWETWDWLSSNPELRRHLPYTERFSSVQVLDSMLSRFGTVYAKQENGKASENLFKISKEMQAYHVFDSEGKEQILPEEKAEEFFSSFIKKKYILQQEIEVSRYEGRHIDFRMIMQKDGNQQWGCTAIITKFGERNGITTIVSDSGFALSGENALRKVFKLNRKQTFRKLEEMTSICIEMCKALERTGGHYADLGVDLMIDKNLKVWILEINNKLPDHSMPFDFLKDANLLQKVLSTPLEYARARAGF